MKYLYMICLIIISLYSCISQREYNRVLNENKDIMKTIEKDDLLTKDVRKLEFKIKNIEFSLQMCEIKLRKQDRNLVECINMRGCK